MPRIELTGWIPVTVTVDTDEQEVVQVNAWDEEFRYGDPPGESAVDLALVALEGLDAGDDDSTQQNEAALSAVRSFANWQPANADEQHAFEIAGEAMWPAWSWGC